MANGDHEPAILFAPLDPAPIRAGGERSTDDMADRVSAMPAHSTTRRDFER